MYDRTVRFGIVFRLISVSMGLSACNSSGHLSNHADIAPNHAGITFAISNTLVSPFIERMVHRELFSSMGLENVICDERKYCNINRKKRIFCKAFNDHGM